MNRNLEAISIIAFVSLIFAGMGLWDTLSLHGFVMGGLFGAYIGFAALPFFNPKKWRPRPLLCGLLASAASVAIALSRTEHVETVILAGLVGGILGVFAPWWAKYA